MLGRTHVAQGMAVWLAGCAATTLAGWPASPQVVIIGAATMAGASLLPDTDHRSGTPAAVAWPVSAWLCDKVADLSAWAYRATGTRADLAEADHRRTGHRTLTHTLLAGLAAGLAATLLAAFAPHGPTVLVAAMAMLAAQAVLPETRVRPVDRWRRQARAARSRIATAILRPIGRAARRTKRAALVWPLGAAAAATAEAYHAGGWWLGPVITAGWYVHLAGDACTEQGVPLWWPAKLRGQRWRMVGLWQPLRIHTGTKAEKVHAVAAVLLAMAGSYWLLVA
jgi:membrane-bound metal-dependent hydrolase YbcI (DUF457 family)